MVKAEEVKPELEPTPQPPAPVPVARPTPPKKPEPVQTAKAAPKPPTPAKKPQPKPEKKVNDFSNVLKTLQKIKQTKPKVEPKPTEAAEAKPAPKTPTAKNARFDANRKLSVSEIDAVRRQVEGCWNVPIGAKQAKSLLIELQVEMGPDRKVRNVEVIDRLRMVTDRAFRAAAESAVRAMRNPKCSPLKLPPDKYETWKTFVITFDPKDMLS